MMDITVATKLGLRIDKATKHTRYGSFWGPGGKDTPYYGRVAGPITLRLAEGVEYVLQEIKVLHHREPLFILGTDELVDNDNQEWRFCWVGLHLLHRRGQWVFTNRDGRLIEIDLAYWPLPIDSTGGSYQPPI